MYRRPSRSPTSPHLRHPNRCLGQRLHRRLLDVEHQRLSEIQLESALRSLLTAL